MYPQFNKDVIIFAQETLPSQALSIFDACAKRYTDYFTKSKQIDKRKLPKVQGWKFAYYAIEHNATYSVLTIVYHLEED
jgi:hypothetical protein